MTKQEKAIHHDPTENTGVDEEEKCEDRTGHKISMVQHLYNPRADTAGITQCKGYEAVSTQALPAGLTTSSLVE